MPRRAAVVAGVLEPVFVGAGCEAVVLGGVAAFETPVFEGDDFFFVADAGDFAAVFGAGDFFCADAGGVVTVFAGDVVFFAGVVSSALHPSAARTAMADQIGIVRMSEFSLARRGKEAD